MNNFATSNTEDLCNIVFIQTAGRHSASLKGYLDLPSDITMNQPDLGNKYTKDSDTPASYAQEDKEGVVELPKWRWYPQPQFKQRLCA